MTTLKFPFHGWRLLALAIVWNLLFLVDWQLLGYSEVGPFIIVAFLGMALVAFSIPLNRNPGIWVVKNSEFIQRWRWVFWYIGFVASAMGVLAVYEVFVNS